MWRRFIPFRVVAADRDDMSDGVSGRSSRRREMGRGNQNGRDSRGHMSALLITVVTYDDTYSIASKTQYAKQAGMGGCFTWSMDQDDGYALHDVMLHNLGR
ncbi:hypothetical protein BJ165DRAFT_1598876 [Panaeolus papilionaceus]|nr:hypothetical protein BJ165DRAFT_1598876 [Panaeolus papilionaceus]